MRLDGFTLKEPFLLGVLSFQTLKDWSHFIVCLCFLFLANRSCSASCSKLFQ